MPYRLKTARTEPARSIVFVVSVATLLLQLLVLTPWVSANFWPVLPNVLVVGAVCVWGIWASWTNNMRQMSTSAFWVSAMWAWSGFMRLCFSPDPSMLLWGPFFVVALCMGVCYIYLSGEKKRLGA